MCPPVPVFLLLVLLATTAIADQPMCGNGPELDEVLRRMADSRAARMRIAGDAAPASLLLRDGTFFVEADPSTMTEYRRFDLAGQSLVFEPRGHTKFAVRRTQLQYVEPTVEPVPFADAEAWYRKYDLSNFAMPLFGQNVTSIYVTAYNGIHLTAPAAENGTFQIDAVEAAVHRNAVLSPLLLTKRKPTHLLHPDLYVQETADAVLITWRSLKGQFFGFDVQAALRRDGSIVFSYKTVRNMEWGAPIVTPGFAPGGRSERMLAAADDPSGDLTTGANSINAMIDVTRVEVVRVGESDLLAFRMKLAKAIDPSAITEAQPLRYWVTAGGALAQIIVERGGTTRVIAPGRSSYDANGQAARFDGDTVELFVTEDSLSLGPGPQRISAYSMVLGGASDAASVELTFDTPAAKIATDLSATSGNELPLPIAEPFVLGALDVEAVWRQIKSTYGGRVLEASVLLPHAALHHRRGVARHEDPTSPPPRVDVGVTRVDLVALAVAVESLEHAAGHDRRVAVHAHLHFGRLVRLHREIGGAEVADDVVLRLHGTVRGHEHEVVGEVLFEPAAVRGPCRDGVLVIELADRLFVACEGGDGEAERGDGERERAGVHRAAT